MSSLGWNGWVKERLGVNWNESSVPFSCQSCGEWINLNLNWSKADAFATKSSASFSSVWGRTFVLISFAMVWLWFLVTIDEDTSLPIGRKTWIIYGLKLARLRAVPPLRGSPLRKTKKKKATENWREIWLHKTPAEEPHHQNCSKPLFYCYCSIN